MEILARRHPAHRGDDLGLGFCWFRGELILGATDGRSPILHDNSQRKKPSQVDESGGVDWQAKQAGPVLPYQFPVNGFEE